MASSRRTASQWQSLIAQWQSSGMTQRAFAEAHGIKAGTLAWWKWKLGQQVRQPSPTEFVEVIVQQTTPGFVLELPELRVHVPHGFDAHELQRLLATLC